MATLEDRILGEKMQYYCSSSEDEEEQEKMSGDENEDDDSNGKNQAVKDADVATCSQELRPWEGTSTNTGPKGVIKDWRTFKQLEAEKRREKERERRQLAKKLTMTCRSHLDDEKEKAAKKKAEEEADDVDSMVDPSVLEAYITQRMQQMMIQAMANRGPQFGRVIHIQNTEQFLNAVDDEPESVTVIIHLYRTDAPGCEAMSGCLDCLSSDYPYVKFCDMQVVDTGLSRKFSAKGVPALLVYKAKVLIGNFVRLTDTFGEDFYSTDVEAFLVEHGVLPDKTLIPSSCIRGQEDDADSDLSIDE